MNEREKAYDHKSRGEKKRMTINAEGRAQNEREEAYDHKSMRHGGEQRMKERKRMTIKAEGRA